MGMTNVARELMGSSTQGVKVAPGEPVRSRQPFFLDIGNPRMPQLGNNIIQGNQRVGDHTPCTL